VGFSGSGFYAMWNGMDPAHVPEFDLMHARNHMAAHIAYLGEGAILAARRHSGGVGKLPPFFTFYDMGSLDVLTAPEYQGRRVVESEWFLRLRPSYRDHIRHHCRVRGRAGAGIGGGVGTFLMRLATRAVDDGAAGVALCNELVARACVTAAHFGIADPTVPTLVGGSPPPRNPEDEPVGVLVVESYDRYALAADLPGIAARLVALGVAAQRPRFAHYGLSLALDHAELSRVHALSGPPPR
jgi:hypothetical protein